MTMDARKQRVLQAIVALYGLEGEPVGSSVLANYFDMAVSSATLRNEMAALTKLGLLEQPHTSAGRVPSAKGYRYYLDNLLTDDQPLDRVTRARVDAVFASLDHEPEKLAQGAAKALAAISGCTAAVSTPCAEDLCIAHYEVVQVGRSAAAVLAVTTAGYVRTRVARVRTGLPETGQLPCGAAQPQPYLCGTGGSFHPDAQRAVWPDRTGACAGGQRRSRNFAGQRKAPCISGRRAVPAGLAAAGRPGG